MDRFGGWTLAGAMMPGADGDTLTAEKISHLLDNAQPGNTLHFSGGVGQKFGFVPGDIRHSDAVQIVDPIASAMFPVPSSNLAGGGLRTFFRR
jgi:hypothetical protein